MPKKKKTHFNGTIVACAVFPAKFGSTTATYTTIGGNKFKMQLNKQ